MVTPLAIPRRYIWVAAGAAVAGAAMFLRNRFAKDEQDEFYEARKSRGAPSKPTTDAKRADEPATAKPADAKPAEAGNSEPGAKDAPKDAAPSDDGAPAGARELADFLSGDSWYDETGWRAIWERETVEDATLWLKTEGKAVLKKERQTLSDHPALLAGCRRRWIVVCRYAGIDVSDAATLWNETDS